MITSTSTSEENTGYTEICKRAANEDAVFSSFKSNLSYKDIVQAVSPYDGYRYYMLLSERSKNQIGKFSRLDSLGSPELFDYPFGRFSPTTLRYVKVLEDLIHYGLDGSRIAEIGAGFGGQYAAIRQEAKPASYDFFVLKEVLQLIEKHTNKLGLNDIPISYESNLEDSSTSREYDLLVSNYAISECSKEVQNVYMDKIVKSSKRGYITFNHLRGCTLTEFINKLESMNKIVSVHEEDPQTGSSNVIITW